MSSDDEDCLECESVLEALEEIDDEADMYGIDFVKSDDEHTAKTVGGVFSTPALVYFRKGIPLVYDGKYMPVFILSEFSLELNSLTYKVTHFTVQYILA